MPTCSSRTGRSDPPVGHLLSFAVENRGTDEATNVVFSVATPPGGTFGQIGVDRRSVLSLPANYEPGEIVCTIDRMSAGDYINIEILLGVPPTPGWSSETTATVRSDQADPDTTNNQFRDVASVPVPPVIRAVRALEDPFRIVITGEDLRLHPFGVVRVGCYEEYVPEVEEVDGTRLILRGGNELRRRFPRGYTVPITILSPTGASVTIPFTRR